MTPAARNENLGNIVLVKNRHKAQQGGAAQYEPSPMQAQPVHPGARPTGSEFGGTTTGATTATTTPTTTGPMPTPTPGTTGTQPQPYAPPDVVMVPLAGTEQPPPTPATTTDQPTATTTATATTTPTATTTATRPEGQATSTTSGTTQPTPSQHVTADEITRKESQEQLKSGCDQNAKWKTYIEKALEGGPEGMANEFRAIRGYLPPMATRIAFDANTEKNRFEDIVCIDQTRVRLDAESYIHASWVNITASKKAILTQLPLRESAADFWQMVLDTDAQAILLILTHAEFNMFHANGVFPAEQDFLHFQGSHVRVGEFKRVVIDRDWTMHVISVRSGDRRKYVHMHHYSGWTHGKQPCRLQDIWQLQSVFRKYTSPHIYMSLSGCGRAGTYAAFEIAHERLHSDNFQKLVISDCVCRARNGRMHAVQRVIQMQTIHAAIMEHMMAAKFSQQLPAKTVQKYEEFSERFNKCADLQEDLQ